MKQRIVDLWKWFRPWLPFVLALVPMMVFRDFTEKNELKYLAIVDEAIANGHYWTFTFQGIPYADKPPLYFWLLLLARWIFGHHIRFVICLFSLIPAMGILHIMERWTRPLFKTSLDASLCQWIMATLGLQLGMAVVARMDMLMCLFIIASLYVYWQKRRGWLFGALLFMGIFSKGPCGILLPLVTTLAWAAATRDWRTWFRMWDVRTWLVLLLGCSVWFGIVYYEGGADYLNNLLFHQTVGRAVHAWHHKFPWWYYLAHVWYTALPWGPLCLVGIGQWLYQRFTRKSWQWDLQAFFIVSFLCTLATLSALSGKLDIYLLPAFPFLAYGGMLQILRWPRFSLRWRTGSIDASQVLMSIVFVGGFVVAFLDY